ncbi:MAG: hypothetical protein ACKO5Q_05970 [Microcystaceae cyanobacterium]
MTWEKSTIGNTCLVGDGAHAKIQRQDQGVLYLTCKNFKQGKLELSRADYISEEDYDLGADGHKSCPIKADGQKFSAGCGENYIYDRFTNHVIRNYLIILLNIKL